MKIINENDSPLVVTVLYPDGSELAVFTIPKGGTYNIQPALEKGLMIRFSK